MKRRIKSDYTSPPSADNYVDRIKEATTALKSDTNRLDVAVNMITVQASELLKTVRSLLDSEIYPPDEYNVSNPDDYEWFLDDSIVPYDKADEYYDAWEAFINVAHRYGQNCDRLRVFENLLDKLLKQ